MSKALFDDLFGDSSNYQETRPTTTTTTTRKKPTVDHDDFDALLDTLTDNKKSSVPSTLRRNETDVNNTSFDNGWNQTGTSSEFYVPSFGGTGGTLNSTFGGQDTIQRIVNQPRPATASGSSKYNDLFSDSPRQPTTVDETAKMKKTVSFDDDNLLRPSTAPSASGNTQNRPKPGGIAPMRTGLEPSRSFDSPAPNKAANESNKKDNWLGINDDTTEDDEEQGVPHSRSPPKAESALSTLTKSNPLAPVPETATKPVETAAPKKSVLDNLLEEDRRTLNDKKLAASAVPPPASKAIDFLFNDLPLTTKRPPTAPPTTAKPIDTFAPGKSSFDNKSDFEDSVFLHDQSNVFKPKAPSSTDNLEVKKLELENHQLKLRLEHMQKQYEMERMMLEDDYKHRLEYIEKACERREQRLKEENEHLVHLLNDRSEQYEKEKTTMILEHQRRLDEIQRDRTSELENLRTNQRQTLDHLRREHEQTIQRLKQLKQEEVSTALDVTTHTRAFETVVDHIEQNARNLDDLRLKLEAKHHSVLSDKEIEARAKEQQLKAYEERLQMQATDFERERKNLQELISRLEVHLSEQTKLVEEERWKALQAQKRMEAMQDALNGEQRLLTEKIARERAEIQRSKDQLLEEQKIALASIYESRSQLAEERAKVEALQKSYQDQKHRDILQMATIEAETRAQQKLVAEQLARLEKREHDLKQREEALLLERRSLSELKQRLENDQTTVRVEHEQLQRKLNEFERATEQLNREKERLAQMYLEVHALDGKSSARLQQLQRSLNHLRQQEEQMSEQYSRVSTGQVNPQLLRSSRSPKKAPSTMDSGFSTMQLAVNKPLLPINLSQRSMEESALLRALRMNALQDQLYIQDEMAFLQNLRTSSTAHLAPRSASLSTLHRQSHSPMVRTTTTQQH